MGHGSRDEEGAAQFVGLLDAVRSAAPHRRIEAGFLEFGGPVLPFIHEVMDRCAEEGVRRIRAIPILLHDAGHTNDDMPREVASARARHASLTIEMTPGFTVSPPLLQTLEDRIQETEAELGATDDDGLAILLVGRGTSNASANGDFFKMGRLLWERNHYGLVECAFVSLTTPSVPEGIARCVRLGARRVLVVPYFLHTGVLVKRIGEQARTAAANYPGVEVAVGEPMGVHPNLVSGLSDE